MNRSSFCQEIIAIAANDAIDMNIGFKQHMVAVVSYVATNSL